MIDVLLEHLDLVLRAADLVTAIVLVHWIIFVIRKVGTVNVVKIPMVVNVMNASLDTGIIQIVRGVIVMVMLIHAILELATVLTAKILLLDPSVTGVILDFMVILELVLVYPVAPVLVLEQLRVV